MRVIIAGSRELTPNIDLIVKKSTFKITQLICGMARGVDIAGYNWAKQHNIPILEFPADWTTYGKRAGYLRNKVMAQNADALIAIWDGYSKGTQHMINLAKQYDLKIYVYLANEV